MGRNEGRATGHEAPVNENFTAVGGQETGDHTEHRGFPASAGAEQNPAFPLGYRQRDRCDSLEIAEKLVDVLHLKLSGNHHVLLLGLLVRGYCLLCPVRERDEGQINDKDDEGKGGHPAVIPFLREFIDDHRHHLASP